MGPCWFLYRPVSAALSPTEHVGARLLFLGAYYHQAGAPFTWRFRRNELPLAQRRRDAPAKSERYDEALTSGLRAHRCGGAGEKTHQDEEGDDGGRCAVDRAHPRLVDVAAREDAVRGGEGKRDEAHVVDAPPEAIGDAPAEPGAEQHERHAVHREHAQARIRLSVRLAERQQEVPERERDV